MKMIWYYYDDGGNIIIESNGAKGGVWAGLETFLRENGEEIIQCNDCKGLYPEYEMSEEFVCKNCQDYKYGGL